MPDTSTGLIRAAVGAPPAPNQTNDVLIIRYLLAIADRTTPISGGCDLALVHTIRTFQSAAGIAVPDGRIDAGGTTLRRLTEQAVRARPSRGDLGPFPRAGVAWALAPDGGDPRAWVDANLSIAVRSVLSNQDFAAAAALLGADIKVALIHAFAEVESGGRSGFGPAGKPVIAYEGHIFRLYSGGKFDATNPRLSYPYVIKAGPEWRLNNVNQDTAWKTLNAAMALDKEAALQACSWGMFQVMGFNFKDCGYPTVDAFATAMQTGAPAHLNAFVTFCQKKTGMVAAMRNLDYEGMARRYNGDDFGDYPKRIEKAYGKYSGG